MKTQTLNPNDFAKYGFEIKPKYLNSKTFLNNVIEITAVYFSTINGAKYTVRNIIK